MSQEKTNIQISMEMWRWLNSRKNTPGETFDDVLRELRDRLEERDDQEELGDDRGDDQDGLELEERDDQEELGDDRDGRDQLDDVLEELDEEMYAELEVNTDRALAEARRAVKWLADRDEPATKSDFLEALVGESPFGERIYWDRAVRPALAELSERGLVEYRKGFHDYSL